LKGSAADWWYRYPSTILNRVGLSERGCVYIVSFVVHAGCCDLSTSSTVPIWSRRSFNMVVGLYVHNEHLGWIDGR
jgi:hypothetical protein